MFNQDFLQQSKSDIKMDDKFHLYIASMSKKLGITQVEMQALLNILGVEYVNVLFAPKNKLITTTSSPIAEQCRSLEANGFVHSMKYMDPNEVEFYVTQAGLAAFKWAAIDYQRHYQP